MQSSHYLLLCASLTTLLALPAAALAGPAQAAHRSWAADHPGPAPDRGDGSGFTGKPVGDGRGGGFGARGAAPAPMRQAFQGRGSRT